ncbi:HD domain-containing protein [Candidatus Peregrinibacteria bacterium]|nr:HD domain-containing protein [Candidatus Peregrinibacteria bacterium]
MHFEQFREAIQKDSRGLHFDRIKKAFLYAQKAHKSQKRESGAPYIMHPLSVAFLLFQNNADEETIVAALLHDTIEDTPYTEKDIRREFGSEILRLVKGVTKFPKFHKNNGERIHGPIDIRTETINKWLVAFNKDLRIALIKIFDRLHNMRTIEGLFSAEKRIVKSQETLDVFAPVAHMLSLGEVRLELEQISLSQILPSEEFRQLKKKIEKRERNISKLISHLKNKFHCHKDFQKFIMKPYPISYAKVYFRSHEGMSDEEILKSTVSCVVMSLEECYQALSCFHGHWRQKKDSFADFINTPKINGYRALHTKIILEDGQEVQLRIMTEEMMRYSQKGVTTFCFSERGKRHEIPWMSMLQKVLAGNAEKSQEFWKGIQSDLLQNFIILHGPHDQIISLPKRSTYLDAAFSYLKDKAVFVRDILVNGAKVPPSTCVEDKARVDFVLDTTENVKYEWLEAVDTSLSMEYIKNDLRKRSTLEKRNTGKRLLQENFDRNNLGSVQNLKDERILKIFRDLDIHGVSDLLERLGEASIFADEVADRILREQGVKISHDIPTVHQLACVVHHDKLETFLRIFDGVLEKVQLEKKDGNYYSVNLAITASREQKRQLLQVVKRTTDVKIDRKDIVDEYSIFPLFFLGIISCIWAAGNVFSYFLIHTEHIHPFLFALVRLWTISLLLGGIALTRRKLENAGDISTPFSASPFGFLAAAISFTAFTVFSYYTLSFFTPSEYVLTLFPNSVIVLFSLFFEQRIFPWSRILLISFLSFGGYLLLFGGGDSIPIEGKLSALFGCLSFGVYTYLSTYFQRKLGIQYQYLRFLLMIFLFSSLIIAGVFTFIDFPFPTARELEILVLYSLFFPGIAYIFYYFLIYKNGYTTYMVYSIFGFLIFSYVWQVIFLKIPLQTHEFFASIVFGLAVYLVAKIYPKLHHKAIDTSF